MTSLVVFVPEKARYTAFARLLQQVQPEAV
jgi:hypothetical protein